MKFVLLGAFVHSDIASLACNCKRNPLGSRSHPERPACPAAHLPRDVQDGLTPNEWPRISPSWHTRGMFTMSATPTEITEEPESLRQVQCSFPSGGCLSQRLISPLPQDWGAVRLWDMWQAGAVGPWIPESSSIPLVSLERCHHEKNLNETIFLLLPFCCALSWV